MTKRIGVSLTSAFTNQPLTIDRDAIEAVEESSEKGARAKVYTKNRGNFYVKEEAHKINGLAFDEVK